MNTLLMLNSLSIRLNGPKAINNSFTINWKITNSNKTCHSELTNCVLINREGLTDNAEVNITISRNTLSEFTLGELSFENLTEQEITIDGIHNI